MSRKLRVGDRVFYVAPDGRESREDKGVVAAVVTQQQRCPRVVILVVWDSDGQVDEFSRRGLVQEGDRVRFTGQRWSRCRAKVQLERACNGWVWPPPHKRVCA